MDDQIEKILNSTGWSCDELLQRLQFYKEKDTKKQQNNSSEAENEKDEEIDVVSIENPAVECSSSKLDTVSTEPVQSNVVPYPKRQFPLADDDLQDWAHVISDSDDESASNSFAFKKIGTEPMKNQIDLEPESNFKSLKSKNNENVESMSEHQTKPTFLKDDSKSIISSKECEKNEELVNNNICESSSLEKDTSETTKTISKVSKIENSSFSKDISKDCILLNKNDSNDLKNESETVKLLEKAKTDSLSQHAATKFFENSTELSSLNSETSLEYSNMSNLTEMKEITSKLISKEIQEFKTIENESDKLNIESDRTSLKESAIKSTSDVISLSTTQKINEAPDFSSSTQEEIRNKVKMQLCNLRSRRKCSLIENLPDIVNSANQEKGPLLLDEKKDDLKKSTCDEVTTVIDKNEVIKVDSLNDTPLKIKVRQFGKTDNGEISITNFIKKVPVIPKLQDSTKSEKPKTIILSRKSLDEPMHNKIETGEDKRFSTENNGLGIVILDVQGAVKDVDEKDNESDLMQLRYTCEEDNETVSEISSNKHSDKNVTETIDCALDQLRKIINKKGDKKSTKTIKSDLKLCNRPKNLSTPSTPQSSSENSNSSFMDIVKPSEEKEGKGEANKSAFLSNQLDEFLTENAKLNISYNVPKLGAEEALRKTRPGTPPALKAEFNREVKRDESQNDERDFRQEKSNISNIKAKTLAEKRKLLEQIVGFQAPDGLILRKKQSEKQSVASKDSNRSYIWYKGRKIYLRSTLTNVCMGQIIDKPPKKKLPVIKPSTTLQPKSIDQSPRKLSLLKQIVPKPKQRYKPGPLSKKLNQFNESDRWHFSLKTLPQVYLEIQPEINKSIPAHILSYLPKNDGSLTSAQVEFALSMLPQKDDESVVNSFKFPIKYKHNQNKILVRERKQIANKNILSPSEKKSVNRDDVASVIDDLIKYVEIKEIADSVIKEDDDLVNKEIEAERKVSPIKSKISEKVSTIVKKTGRSKVALELARLSCKIINVTVDNGEDNEEEKDCGKMHCRLGCVCQKKSFTLTHCGKIECMFNCTCPVDKIIKDNQEITLPPGTDLLSADTVNHLQDVAKKDLAKVEKDFTQTVISAPDKTIVLGLNGGKPRRETKPPVKYTNDLSKYKSRRARTVDLLSEKEENKQRKHIKRHRCFVSLPKIIVTHIIPFCMVHEKLNCECKGLATFPDSPKKIQPEIKAQVDNSPKENEFEPPKKLIKRKEILVEAKTQKSSDDSCDTILIVDEVDDFLPPQKESLSDSNRQLNKRKQSFNEIRSEKVSNASLKNYNTNQAIQRRQSKTIQVNTDKSVDTVFEGEIIIDLRNIELLKDLGLKTTDARCTRLLSWYYLQKNYQSRKIKIWCHVKKSARLLINTSDKQPPKFYTEIDNLMDSERLCSETDVAAWIRAGKLPKKHNAANFYFIIKPTKIHYEICGICTRNLIEQSKSLNANSDVKEKIQLACLNNTSLKIFKRLEVGDHNDFKCDDLHYIKLPALAMGTPARRWRVLYVVEPFSYLKLERNGYCIKYIDIRQVQKKAQNLQKTIVFRSPELYRDYNEPQFGIYCDYKCDRFVFVGPYGMNEDPGVKTYKTDGGTKIFEVKNSFWIIQASDSELTKIPKESLEERNRKLQFERASKISILKRPNPLALSKMLGSAKRTKIDPQSSSADFPMPSGKEVLLLHSNPKAPENFNRIIVTNVPKFGYLGATQHPTFDVIDISWPNENKYLRFADQEAAIEFLKQRFQDVFLTIPDDFELTFKVIKDVDVINMKPFDVRYLKGHYICGPFGICDLKMLSNGEAIKKTGMTKEALLMAYNEKMHNLISKHLTELERVLELSTENDKMIKLNIFEKAVKQIRQLEEKQRELLAEKVELSDNRNDLNNKIQSLVAKLYVDNRQIGEKSSNERTPVETIEIFDDDDYYDDDICEEYDSANNGTKEAESKAFIIYANDNKNSTQFTQISLSGATEIEPTGFVPLTSLNTYSKATITPISSVSTSKTILLNKSRIGSTVKDPSNVIKSPFNRGNISNSTGTLMQGYSFLAPIKNVKLQSKPQEIVTDFNTNKTNSDFNDESSNSSIDIVTPIIVDVTSMSTNTTDSISFSNVVKSSETPVVNCTPSVSNTRKSKPLLLNPLSITPSNRDSPPLPPLSQISFDKNLLPVPKLISFTKTANATAKKSTSGIIKKKSSAQKIINIQKFSTIPVLKKCKLVKQTNGQYILVKNPQQKNAPEMLNEN